jgi:hypothetical protein
MNVAVRLYMTILHPFIRRSSNPLIGFPLSGRLQQVLVDQSPIAALELILPLG